MERLDLDAASSPDLWLLKDCGFPFIGYSVDQSEKPLAKFTVTVFVPGQLGIEAAIIAIGLRRLTCGKLILNTDIRALGRLLLMMVVGVLRIGGHLSLSHVFSL